MAGRHRTLRLFHQAAEQLFEFAAIDAQIGGLPYLLVEPGRALGKRELPRPHVRLRVRVHHEALGLDLLHRIRRRRLDPIDLVRQQRCRPRAGLRHRQQDDARDLRLPIGIPIVVVLDVLHPLARREGRHLEGARARRIGGERRPRLLGAIGRVADAGKRVILLLPMGRRGHEQVRQVDGEGVGLPGGQLDGVVIDLARRHQCRHAAHRDADLIGREMDRALVQHLIDVPDDGVGRESEPSWNLTPLRSLKTHLVLSAESTLHSVAMPGITTLGLSAEDKSHCVRASNSGMPVKRLPSKPWSGWPLVRGMSAAVMATRSVFS